MSPLPPAAASFCPSRGASPGNRRRGGAGRRAGRRRGGAAGGGPYAGTARAGRGRQGGGELGSFARAAPAVTGTELCGAMEAAAEQPAAPGQGGQPMSPTRAVAEGAASCASREEPLLKTRQQPKNPPGQRGGLQPRRPQQTGMKQHRPRQQIWRLENVKRPYCFINDTDCSVEGILAADRDFEPAEAKDTERAKRFSAPLLFRAASQLPGEDPLELAR